MNYRQEQGERQGRPFRPERREDVIHSREFSAERKNYLMEFRENERGQFLRITEESRGKRNVLIIPSSGIDDFIEALDDLMDEVDAQQDAGGQSPEG
jgi:aromatic ring-cleaving dioxygenase